MNGRNPAGGSAKKIYVSVYQKLWKIQEKSPRHTWPKKARVRSLVSRLSGQSHQPHFKDVGGPGALLSGPVDHLAGEGGVVQVAHETLALGVVAVGLAGDDQNGRQRQTGSGVLEADVPSQGRAPPGRPSIRWRYSRVRARSSRGVNRRKRYTSHTPWAMARAEKEKGRGST